MAAAGAVLWQADEAPLQMLQSFEIHWKWEHEVGNVFKQWMDRPPPKNPRQCGRVVHRLLRYRNGNVVLIGGQVFFHG
jgi:hypothetical protein